MTNRKTCPRLIGWDQLDDESAQAYAAFQLYLQTPPHERSLDLAYQRHYAQKWGHPKGNVKKAPGRWRKWSTDHQWTERALAYDAAQQRKAMIRAVNRRQKDVEQFIAADMMIGLGVQRITSRQVAAMMQADPAEVNASELRLVCMSYDAARGWLTQLIGLFDDTTQPLNQLAASDEALADRLTGG